MKACRGCRGIVPLILNRDPRYFIQQLMACTADQQDLDLFSNVKSVSDIWAEAILNLAADTAK